jgi:hypothetical protein
MRSAATASTTAEVTATTVAAASGMRPSTASATTSMAATAASSWTCESSARQSGCENDNGEKSEFRNSRFKHGNLDRPGGRSYERLNWT